MMPRTRKARPITLSLVLTSLFLLSMFSLIPLNAFATSGSSQLTVSSQNTSGQTITGYYTVLYGSGKVIGTGFTPATFSLNNGVAYEVSVSNYGSCTFSQWSSGSTANPISISINSNTALMAVYNCGTHSGSSVTVNSVNQNGNTINGYYVILYNSAGSVLGTGFTPKTFSVTSNTAYEIQADNYGSCVFAQWSNGMTSNPLTFTATSAGLTFTAMYQCGGGGGGPSTVTIKSINQNGTAISGYYTALYNSGGSVAGSGFTPASFKTTAGQVYSVRVENYGDCQFVNWTSGATSDPMPFTATSTPQSFTAVYFCGTVKSPPGITITDNRIPAPYWAPCFATVCARGTGPGASMWVVLYNSTGGIVATGFADEHGHTFTGLNASAVYYIYPADCDLCHGSTHDVLFTYWGNSTGAQINATRPLQVKVGETVNAWYSCTNGCGGG